MNVMVILNYNDSYNTISYLSRIVSFSCIDKYVVVDNQSTDDSYQRFLELPDNEKVIFLKTKENKGYGHGNNVGVKYAMANFYVENIVISNPDIVVAEEAIQSILEALDGDGNMSAATGLICDTSGEVAFNFAWKLPNYVMMLQNTSVLLTKTAQKIGVSRFYNTNDLKGREIVEVLSGCFFAIKANIFEEVGYFDEDTFLYNEENILFYKLEHLGYKQVVLCECPIIHYQGSSTSKSIKKNFQKQKIIVDSERVYLKKYLKINSFQWLVYRALSFFGRIEKYILYKIKTFGKGTI